MNKNGIALFINNDSKLDIIISVDENNVWISLIQIGEILYTDKDIVYGGKKWSILFFQMFMVIILC